MSALRGLGWSVFALIHSAGTALALDPHQAVSNYLRKDFTVEDGLPANQVNEILQTDNGFLWVATDAGLARFDGQRFTLIRFRDEFANEKAQLLKILDAARSARTADSWKPHPMSGKMTPKEWGKLLQIDVDYHLRQFAA
jgi:ligand-binding sensor domain-containing protein